MSIDSITRMKDAGFQIDAATSEQKSALATLSDSEVDVLLKVKEIVDSNSPDVEGHEDSSGGWLW